MKRAIAAVLVFIAVAGGAAFVRISWAAPPMGCLYREGGYDNLQSVIGGDKLTADKFNIILCILNKLMQDTLSGHGGGGGGPGACAAVTNLSPGHRVIVDVVLPGGVNLLGGEPVAATVKDSAATPRLAVDGIQSCLGATCKVPVWNRDAAASHSGSVCVQVRS